MKNLEQTLAKTLLSEYRNLAYGVRNAYEEALMDIAQSIWGSNELNLHSHYHFMETLKEIANSEPQANLVEVDRFEAFGLYKHYSAKSVSAMQEGFEGLAESYSERADKWLEIAVKIEKSNADDVNKNLVVG